MKILYICSDSAIPVLGRHGAAVHVRSLTTALHRLGHSVILAAPLLNKSAWEQPAVVSSSVLHVPPTADTTAAVLAIKTFNRTLGVSSTLPGEIRRILYNKDLPRQLRGRFSDDPPDFVYERASLYSVIGVQVARELNRPLVVELNAPLALEQETYRGCCLGELAKEAERWTLSQADVVLVVSATLRDYVLNMGIEPNRVHIIPNGVDGTLFRPRWSRTNGVGGPSRVGKRLPSDQERESGPALANGTPVLGFVGGLKKWHGVEILPRLLERLVVRHPHIRLVITGDGPLLSVLQRDFGENGLLERVDFVGAVPHEEVPDWINSFDVALAPYPRPDHPFYFSPLKVFEYMACGVPMVASRLGQIEEVVRHGETGLLYSPGELDELANACDRLLADPELRRRLGQAAADDVHRRYTWEQNAARVIELMQSLPKTQEVDP